MCVCVCIPIHISIHTHTHTHTYIVGDRQGNLACYSPWGHKELDTNEQQNWIHACTCTHRHTHTHTMEYSSTIKQSEIMPFAATWIDLEIIMLKDVSQRERQMSYDLYVASKIWHKWTYLWNRSRLTDIENRLVVAEGTVGWARSGLRVWD